MPDLEHLSLYAEWDATAQGHFVRNFPARGERTPEAIVLERLRGELEAVGFRTAAGHGGAGRRATHHARRGVRVPGSATGASASRQRRAGETRIHREAATTRGR